MLHHGQISDGAGHHITAFQERAASLGVDVHRVALSRDAVPVVESLASQFDTPLLISTELASSAPAFIAGLDDSGVAWRFAEEPATSNDAPLGLSLAHLAIAETASVLLSEPSLEDRGIGMLVATQLVLCPTDRLVPALDQAASVLRQFATQPGGAYTTLVTGPSRTADIERALTVGVQGPAKLSVLFVDTLN